MRINSAYSRRPLARHGYCKGMVACWRTGVGRWGRDDARATTESADSPSNNGIRRSTNPLMPKLRSFFSRVSLSFTLSFLGSFLIYIVRRFSRRYLIIYYEIFWSTFYLLIYLLIILCLFFCFYLYILSNYICSDNIRFKIVRFPPFSFFFSHFFLFLSRVLILHFYVFINFVCVFWKNMTIN